MKGIARQEVFIIVCVCVCVRACVNTPYEEVKGTTTVISKLAD